MGYLPGRRSSQTSPGKNDNLHLVTATFTAQGPGSIGLSLVLQGRPPVYGLICGSYSSARNFALRWTFQPPQSGFLQIPPHDGHPCLWLTVPATESVVDFHHQVVAHAGRTRNTGLLHKAADRYLVYNLKVNRSQLFTSEILKQQAAFAEGQAWSYRHFFQTRYRRRQRQVPAVCPLRLLGVR